MESKTDGLIQFVDSKELSEQALLQVAAIDSAIPLDYDPNYVCGAESGAQRLKYYRELVEPHFFKVARNDAEIIGFHILQFFQWQQIRAAQIVTLWVHPNYRKQGIAKSLKQAGREWARKNKLSFIQTAVHRKNQRMVEMNLNAGFEEFSVIMRLNL